MRMCDDCAICDTGDTDVRDLLSAMLDLVRRIAEADPKDLPRLVEEAKELEIESYALDDDLDEFLGEH